MSKLAWMNPKELPLESENAIAAMRCDAPEKLLHGKVRTGKTRMGLKEVIAPMFKYPGMKVGIFRANAVDMRVSIRPDLRDICSQAWGKEIKVEGGQQFHTLHINGGECRLLGLNQENHLLGAKYDRAFISQLEQINPDHYQKLKTRMQGDAMVVNGRPVRRIISDANPDEPDSWIYEREADGLLKVIDLDFKDNPYFFRNGRWTVGGYDYVRDLHKSMSGLNYDRYVLGLRVSAQGAVFHLDNCHFINIGELPDLSLYHKYIAIDWGWVAPTVVLWIAWNHLIDDVICYREWRTNNEDSISVGNQINEINAHFGETIEDYIIDRDDEKRSNLRKYCGIRAKQVKKFPGSRLAGYNHIHYALKCQSLGEPGGLRFYRDMLYRSSVDHIAYKGAENMIKEMRTVKFSETRTDEIEKEGDHGPDALGYFYLYKMRRRSSYEAVDYSRVA